MGTENIDAEWIRSHELSPYSLRFELGGESLSMEDDRIPRFLRAFDRVRAIADYIFEPDKTCVAIVGFLESTDRHELFWGKFKPGATDLGFLKETGFNPTAHVAQWSAVHFRGDEEEDLPCTWRSFEITGRKPLRDTLFWCSISKEMAIRPSAPVTSILACPELDLMIYVYDDRGMDISSLDPGRLIEIYRDFNSWLLDYDRERMSQIFDKAGT